MYIYQKNNFNRKYFYAFSANTILHLLSGYLFHDYTRNATYTFVASPIPITDRAPPIIM